MVCDWLPDCWRIDSSPTSAAVGDRNRWDNAPFLRRYVVKKWLSTGACLCATSTCWLQVGVYVCTDMLFVFVILCSNNLLVFESPWATTTPSSGETKLYNQVLKWWWWGGRGKVKNSCETQIMDLDVDDVVFFMQVYATAVQLGHLNYRGEWFVTDWEVSSTYWHLFLCVSLLVVDGDPGWEAETVSVRQWGRSVSWHQRCCTWRPCHDCVITTGCCKGHAGSIKADH